MLSEFRASLNSMKAVGLMLGMPGCEPENCKKKVRLLGHTTTLLNIAEVTVDEFLPPANTGVDTSAKAVKLDIKRFTFFSICYLLSSWVCKYDMRPYARRKTVLIYCQNYHYVNCSVYSDQMNISQWLCHSILQIRLQRLKYPVVLLVFRI